MGLQDKCQALTELVVYIVVGILVEALESVMCDVIKIHIKSGKENQPLNIKAAVEWPILKLGLPNIRTC